MRQKILHMVPQKSQTAPKMVMSCGLPSKGFRVKSRYQTQVYTTATSNFAHPVVLIQLGSPIPFGCFGLEIYIESNKLMGQVVATPRNEIDPRARELLASDKLCRGWDKSSLNSNQGGYDQMQPWGVQPSCRRKLSVKRKFCVSWYR